jgi:hypothetical protein
MKRSWSSSRAIRKMPKNENLLLLKPSRQEG